MSKRSGSNGVCPKCKSANFTQSHDLDYFVCNDCGRKFRLIPTAVICLKCGYEYDALQHRAGWNAVSCPKCKTEQLYDFPNKEVT